MGRWGRKADAARQKALRRSTKCLAVPPREGGESRDVHNPLFVCFMATARPILRLTSERAFVKLETLPNESRGRLEAAQVRVGSKSCAYLLRCEGRAKTRGQPNKIAVIFGIKREKLPKRSKLDKMTKHPRLRKG